MIIELQLVNWKQTKVYKCGYFSVVQFVVFCVLKYLVMCTCWRHDNYGGDWASYNFTVVQEWIQSFNVWEYLWFLCKSILLIEVCQSAVFKISWYPIHCRKISWYWWSTWSKYGAHFRLPDASDSWDGQIRAGSSLLHRPSRVVWHTLQLTRQMSDFIIPTTL